MMDRVQSGHRSYDALQGLEAQRRFSQANRTGSIFKQALQQELETAPPVQQHRPNPAVREEALRRLQLQSRTASQSISESEWSNRSVESPVLPSRDMMPRVSSSDNPSRIAPQQPVVPLQNLLHEVSQLAQQVGFVGMRSEDILSAYHNGHSLLADYKV